MVDSQSQTDIRTQNRYEDFLLAEYENISQAHYNTVETISTFFKHYLLIVSVPIPLLAFGSQRSLGQSDLAASILSSVPYLAIVIALVGLCVMVYIANLRFDALLYARGVNGIRKYFFDHAPIEFHEELRFRVLPRSTSKPRYFEGRYFLFVVMSFGIFDSLYLGVFLYNFFCLGLPLLGVCLGFIGFHVLCYAVLAHYRESSYLRSRIIGIDVDGVLTDHCKQFCTLLKKKTGKSVEPCQITYIPVHDCVELDVSRDDEMAVFNAPCYWKEMPVIQSSADVVKELRNALKYKIWIFTHRDWPQVEGFPAGNREEYKDQWNLEKTKLEKFRSRHCRFSYLDTPGLEWLLSLLRASWIAYDHTRPIRRMTARWLSNNGFIYDKLVVEKGNLYTTDRSALVKNRFVLAKRKQVQIFVEDDLYKAIRLANICEVVFLFRQPYNQRDSCSESEEENPVLPKNVIPVNSWEEIRKVIREKL